ncbi:hypothetical protein EAF00_000041 [Botryotinia globosa]|nr:hypothetical protein EAF00_000041 [Botryotinia globosa]
MYITARHFGEASICSVLDKAVELRASSDTQQSTFELLSILKLPKAQELPIFKLGVIRSTT